MLKVSKLADYATMLLAIMANNPKLSYKAPDLAKKTHLALPTVSKILKLLVRKGILSSLRGVNGGYQLTRAPSSINIAEILSAIEGDFAMTDCSHLQGHCSLESLCNMRSNWQLISQAILNTLQLITLADIAKPMSSKQFLQPKMQLADNKIVV
jgi:FeS assembly SUF system regulator